MMFVQWFFLPHRPVGAYISQAAKLADSVLRLAPRSGVSAGTAPGPGVSPDSSVGNFHFRGMFL